MAAATVCWLKVLPLAPWKPLRRLCVPFVSVSFLKRQTWCDTLVQYAAHLSSLPESLSERGGVLDRCNTIPITLVGTVLHLFIPYRYVVLRLRG